MILQQISFMYLYFCFRYFSLWLYILSHICTFLQCIVLHVHIVNIFKGNQWWEGNWSIGNIRSASKSWPTLSFPFNWSYKGWKFAVVTLNRWYWERLCEIAVRDFSLPTRHIWNTCLFTLKRKYTVILMLSVIICWLQNLTSCSDKTLSLEWKEKHPPSMVTRGEGVCPLLLFVCINDLPLWYQSILLYLAQLSQRINHMSNTWI